MLTHSRGIGLASCRVAMLEKSAHLYTSLYNRMVADWLFAAQSASSCSNALSAVPARMLQLSVLTFIACTCVATAAARAPARRMVAGSSTTEFRRCTSAVPSSCVEGGLFVIAAVETFNVVPARCAVCALGTFADIRVSFGIGILSQILLDH